MALSLKNFFQNPDNQDRLAGIGAALGALDRGQVADLSQYRDSIDARQADADTRAAINDPSLLERFTPEQRQMLSTLPPQVAQQIIADSVFAPAPAPVEGTVVDGRLVNPITGEVIYEGQPQEGWRALGADEVTQLGLPPGAYQIGPDNKISAIGGSGQNITINNGESSNLYGDAPAGTVYEYDADGNHVMEEAPGGGQRPRVVPLAGTEAEERVAGQVDDAEKSNAQADSMLATIDGLLADPGLDSAVGVMGVATGVLGPLSPEAARARSRIEQIQGQAFLQAFDSLKGGGQITEIEGQKAEAAIARLNTAQSADDYRDALNDLKDVILSAAGGSDSNGATETRRLMYDPETGSFN